MSRTKKSAINSVVGLIFSLISNVLSFALQAIFIRLLGLEYSGINSLFTNIMSILNISQLGFNNAILFHLYKKIADNDEDGIALFLSAYRKICLFVSGIILVGGLCCIPFLDRLVNEKPKFPESLWSLYIIVLLTSVFIEALSYRHIFILAKQDRYIYTIVNYSSLFLCHGLQIFVLFLWGNIYLYLLVKLFTSILREIVCGKIVKKRYGVKWYSKQKLSADTKKGLFKDVGALSVYKVCRTIDSTVDTFLISKFIHITLTAIYASFTMLLNALSDLLSVFNDGMIASVGDLHATGNKKKVENVFYQSVHFNFLVFGVFTSVLAAILGPFVEWWIGHTLSTISICFLLINFYIHGFSQNVSTFRNSMGLFRRGWKQPAVTVVLNLIFSIFLIRKIGLLGTLIGTFLSSILTKAWYDPFVVCKYGFEQRPYKYYFRYICYSAATIVTVVITNIIAKLLNMSGSILGLVVTGFVCLFVSVIILFGFGFVFKEQKILFARIKNIVFGFLKK